MDVEKTLIDLYKKLIYINFVCFSPPIKRPKMVPPLNERVMLYVRQDAEEVYTPLHVAPPTTTGLLNAVSTQPVSTGSSEKFQIEYKCL
jgi:hypothetical protein